MKLEPRVGPKVEYTVVPQIAPKVKGRHMIGLRCSSTFQVGCEVGVGVPYRWFRVRYTTESLAHAPPRAHVYIQSDGVHERRTREEREGKPRSGMERVGRE